MSSDNEEKPLKKKKIKINKPREFIVRKYVNSKCMTTVKKYPENFEDIQTIAAKFGSRFSVHLVAAIVFSQSTFTRDKIASGPCAVRWVGFGKFSANPYLIRKVNESRGRAKTEYSASAFEAFKELERQAEMNKSIKRNAIDDITSQIINRSLNKDE